MRGRARAERFRKRITCEMLLDGRPRRGIVLDVSTTGLFVQTASQPPPDTVLDLRLLAGGDRPEMALRVRVARQRKVEPRLAQIQANGVGLEILEAPPAYYERVVEQEAPSRAQARRGVLGGGSSRPGRAGSAGARASAAPARAEAAPKATREAMATPQTTPKATPEAMATPQAAPKATREAMATPQANYKVRVSQTEGTRSRTVTVAAASEDAARGAALERVGEGWEVVEVRAA